MLGKLPCKVKSARDEGAYDPSRFRKKVHEKEGICIVPPPRDAAYKGTDESWEKERDDAIAAIYEFGGDDGGRRLWKMCSG